MTGTLAGAVALAACLVSGAGGASAQAAPVSYRFDIAPQPLDRALAELATVSGVDIAYRQSLAAGHKSGTVRGTYPAPVALQMLLRGTGLAARFTGPRAAIIFEAETTDAPAANRSATSRGGPSLRLDMAVVRAPATIIGTRDRTAHRDYAMAVQNEVREWLRVDGAYRGRAFRLQLRLSVDPRGVLHDVMITRPTADQAWDRHVVRILANRPLSTSPPPDLTGPLAFEVVSDRVPDESPRPRARRP
ncbi:MAG: hypothetical protein ABW182_12670 [Sphingomonas sp.]